MISLEKGMPFAEVIDGKYKGVILRVSDDMKLKKNVKPVKKIDIDDGQLVPVPNPNARQILYIAAPEGSGKSWFAATYMEGWRDLFPENNAWVFSRKPNDEVIDSVGVKRIRLDKTLVTDPIDFLEEMEENDLVLFDDIETITDDKVKKAIYKLEADLIDVGRAHKIYVLSTSHLINGNDRIRTRTLLNSAHFFVIFPIGGNAYQITYLLKQYVGLDREQIQDILNTTSRWIVISRKVPPFVYGQTFAYLLK